MKKRVCTSGGMITEVHINLSQYHFVHHKSHVDWPGFRPGSPKG